MTYEEATALIKNKKSLGIQPGLSRMRTAMERIGNVQNQLKVIHVAGTNGKGTVCGAVAQALMEKGYRVGLFTSPWVIDYREQIQINGKWIAEKDFAEYTAAFQSLDLTEFELVTAIMFAYFYDQKVDYAVIECGMGGANDSTNVLDYPLVAVLTSVALDHTAFLGETLEEIAAEKSGIIKKGCTAVLYPNLSTKDVFMQRCRTVGCQYIEAPSGENYLQNDLNVAASVLQALGVDAEVKLPDLPARCEKISDNILLDGAHNPDGAEALLTRLPKDKSITAVVAMMKDKDAEKYLALIAPKCRQIIVTTLPYNPRAMTVNDLAALAEKYCSSVCTEKNPHHAVQLGREKSEFLLICGSFYLAREIRKDL